MQLTVAPYSTARNGVIERVLLENYYNFAESLKFQAEGRNHEQITLLITN